MTAVPFALNFTGDVDPLAIATFVLALVTLAAVVIAARALHASQAQRRPLAGARRQRPADGRRPGP